MHRDTVGLHISAWPCGVVNDFVGKFPNFNENLVCMAVFIILVHSISSHLMITFTELYGSESISQVHATLVDFLGDIPEESANGVVGFLYDDM